MTEAADKVQTIFSYFEELFGKEPRCELNYKTDIDLLVAIILSAQCTDKRVNQVTKTLFQKYKTLQDYANSNIAELESEIHSTGFYRNKAKNIKAMANTVLTEHNGQIPTDLEALTTLPGVGRKTASVFLCEFYRIPAMPVDTHVERLSRRLGFSNGKNPLQIERDLRAILPIENWANYHLLMVLFGRYNCTARNPKCDACKLKENQTCSWIK